MKNKLIKSILIHLSWFSALVLVFWLFSAFEIYSNYSPEKGMISVFKSISLKFLNDFWTVFLIALLFFPISYFLSDKSPKIHRFLLSIIGILIVLIQLSLVKYSQVAKLNLGSDLLGYSYDDIVLTVSSSTSFSIFNVLSFFIAPALFVLLAYCFRKKRSEKILSLIFIAVFIIVLPAIIFSSEIKADIYKNKTNFLVRDILSFKLNQNQDYSLDKYGEYPLLKSAENTKDVLKPFFNIDSLQTKPNIVFVILEGLGTEFIDENTHSGFSPFIDSLLNKSLYWENFLSTTGRTFGVLPSLFGSLPYGKMGFLEIENTPRHQSLFSILHDNGYTTSFYTGTKSTFDKAYSFLDHNKVTHIIDENKFGNEYNKSTANENGFSWGYPDEELFRKMLTTLDEKKQPRLDVLLTVSNHEPFDYPNKNEFISNVENIFGSNKNIKLSKEEVTENIAIYAALNYVDNSLKDFFKKYELRADYQNTIFIITGDHRLIPIEQKDKICRFHVPLIIYSPLLKKPQRFKGVSSHFDVTPSLVSFLKNNYRFNTSSQTAWLGKGLDTSKSFRNNNQIGLMRYKGSLKDFVYKNYFYSDEQLFKMEDRLVISKINNPKILQEVKDSFAYFKELNVYLTKNNKIVPDTLKGAITVDRIIFSAEQLDKINEVAQGKTSDDLFIVARKKAFEGDREFARLLCDYVLNSVPDHVDFIILKGRTLAWDGKYLEAEKNLLIAINKFPYYDDPYLALMDTYIWSEQAIKSIETGKKALKNQIKNPEIGFKLAKAYNILEKKEASLKIIDSLTKLYPKNEAFLKFKKTLK